VVEAVALDPPITIRAWRLEPTEGIEPTTGGLQIRAGVYVNVRLGPILRSASGAVCGSVRRRCYRPLLPPRRLVIVSSWSPAGGRVLVGQPLHECDRRIARAAHLVTDGSEGPGQALQVVQIQLVVHEAVAPAGWR
jgi:hypothetical protein